MKKIIYSLVIMIAAGSLFTSCVENTEPQGIRDLREAKADYLASLSKLREADAEKVKAEAAYVQAQTETEKAEAAWQQALVEQQKLLNEALAKQNEEDAARIEASIENIKAQAAIDATKKQKALAEAQEELEKALKNIAAQSYELTDIERGVIGAYTRAYSDYIEAQKAVRGAEVKLYEATYDYKGENSVEAQKALYEGNKAYYEVGKAFFEAKLASNLEKAEDQIANYEEWVEEYEALKAEIAGFEYDKAEIQRDSALNEYENKAALDSFYAKVDAKAAAIATARGGFSFAKFEKALPVLSFKDASVSVVETFSDFARNITTVTIPADNKKLTVEKATGDAGKKVVKNVVDSLNIIIDALNREKVVVDQIVKDTTGIAALVAKTNAEYKAVKDTLSAGINAWQGIKAAKEAEQTAKGKPAAARAQHAQDTAALFESIRNFIDVWNEIAGTDGKDLATQTIRGQKYNDSLDIFNALKSIMEERTKVFNKDAKFGIYVSSRSGQKTKDSVLFSQIDFKDLQDGTFNQTATGSRNGFLALLNEAFGTEDLFKDFMKENSNKLHITKISVSDIKGKGGPNPTKSVLFQNLLFGEWYVLGETTVYGEIYKAGAPTEDTKYAKIYCKQAVTDSTNASNLVIAARKAYYEKFYCTYWGVTYEDLSGFDKTAVKFTNEADSLHVDAFTEKTFTDPKVLVTFSGKEGETVFTPAKDKDEAKIEWKNVNYNDTSVALKAIEKQIGKNYIKLSSDADYTLYAKTLAVAQFASAAVNYKENTQALAELTKIVKDVETAYNNAVSAASAGSAKADSLMIALTGKKDGSNPIVNHNLAKGGFINVDGTFKLAGEQKTLAEKWVADYAKTWAELEKQKKAIAATTESHTKLAEIYNDYVKALSALEDKFAGNADQIYKAIVDKWEDVLEKIQIDIEKYQYQIELCEGNIAKLEAGYDGVQIAIESAQDELAKALAALEAAEAKLAAAEAAYKQVLANHGITE